MIRHLVLFSLREGISRNDARVREAVKALEELPRKIEEIREWEHGPNLSARAVACDYGLSSAFDDEEGLAGYVEHPAHQEAVRLWKQVADWTICDYTFG